MKAMPVLMAAVMLVWPVAARAGADKPKALLRIHLQIEGGANLSERQAVPVSLPTGEQIYINALPEISEHDLLVVVPRQTEKGPVLYVKLNAHGTQILSNATIQNQGRQMVVFLNGRILYAPVIDTQITTGDLVIPRTIAPVELQALQETIRQNKP